MLYIDISNLKNTFLSLNCKSLSTAFNQLRVNDIINLVTNGLYPKYLTKKCYTEVIKMFPLNIYMFKSKHILIMDLISVISNDKFNNLDKYSHHISFYKSYILKKCNSNIISKCIQYMVISDDDIRYLIEKFNKNTINHILSFINCKSITSVNYIFNEIITEKILIRDYSMYSIIYNHQIYNVNFLKYMLYKHGIIPVNIGILELLSDPKTILDILMLINKPRDMMYILDIIDEYNAKDEMIQQYIINKINNGTDIECFYSYVEEFLYNRINELGIYSNIFFKNHVDISKCDNLTKKELKVICDHIDKYDIYIDFIIDTIIKYDYISLLSVIIDKIPIKKLTEELCMKIIIESDKPIKVKSLPIHNITIMTICNKMGYDDIVDFLDMVSLNDMLKKGIDPITDYVFTTNWYNKLHILIKLFVKKYGFCSYKMRKLMFEYPLDIDSIHYLLDEIDNMDYTISDLETKSLVYLLCVNNEIKHKNILINEIQFNEFDKNKQFIIFKSNDYKLKAIIIINNVPKLQIFNVKDLNYVKIKKGICIQFTSLYKQCENSEERVLSQLLDILLLSLYGLYYIPFKYIPNWIPIIDIIRCNKYYSPNKIEYGTILNFSYEEFIKYEYLSDYVTNLYSLSEPISNYHAAVNSIFVTLFVYIIIGSTKHTKKTIYDFIISFINILNFNVKISYTNLDNNIIIEVCKEIETLKTYISNTGFVFIKKKSLTNTLLFCERICVNIILYNNRLLR
nr:IEV morphogenesis protein [Wadden Sea poxvirus]